MSFMMPNNRKKPGTATVPASSYDTDVPPEWKINDTQEVAPEIQSGIFGGTRDEEAQAPFGLNTGAPVAMASSRNVLNSDVAVVGILRFTDDLLVDGTVEGEITSEGELTVGANAVIQAGAQNKVAVRTKSAIIQGRVNGDVVVTDRVELTSTAELVGDVTASKISIQEGAVFIGHCMVGVASAANIPSPAAAKKPKTAKTPVNNNLLG